MRQFETPIKTIVGGLRRELEAPRDPILLTESMNAKPRITDKILGTRKLIPHEYITDPLAAQTLAWPHPQIFRTANTTLLAAATAVSTIIEGATWSASAITTYDYASTSSAKAIITGGAWHLADSGVNWFLFNGNNVVFQDSANRVGGSNSNTLVQDDITIQTGCMHRHRMIMGGFNTSDFWLSAWVTQMATFHNLLPSGFTTTGSDVTPGSNWIMWSSIGGGAGDLYWLLYPTTAQDGFVSGAHDATRPLWIEEFERNEWGWGRLPFQGTVRVVKPLGNSFIAWSDGGVCAFTLLSDPAGYGEKTLSRTSVQGRGAVGGSDEDGYVWIDDIGYLHYISPDLKDERIGYKEFFEPMIGNTIIVTFDPLFKEFYISDHTRCYVLTEGGLGQGHQLPTNLHRVDSTLYSILRELGDYSYRITTGILDFGISAMKTIDSIEVIGGPSERSHLQACVSYRYSSTEPFRDTPWVVLNKEGVARTMCTAPEFKIRIRGSHYSNVDIDYIIVRWKVSDFRHIGGLYGTSSVVAGASSV